MRKYIPYPSTVKRNIFLSFIGILFSNYLFTQPTISSFSPASGPVGTSVTISGTNFSSTALNNIVYFGAVRATVTSASTTSLTVTVPAGASYQPISVMVNYLTGYSTRPFVVTFPGGGDIHASIFTDKTDFTTDLHPNGVVVVDLNGDGKPDMATANNYSTTGSPASISILRNTSSGGVVSFAPKLDINNGVMTYAIAAADLNCDSLPDLIASSIVDGNVSVFINTSLNGNISFASKIDFSTGSSPYSIGIADIDGDGKPDMAVLNSTTQTVSVFRNTSSGGVLSFATKLDLMTGIFPQALVMSDLDGDGKADIAFSNRFSNSFSVLRNTSSTGTISFAPKVDIDCGTGNEPYGIAAGDLDGDAKTDIAIVINNVPGSAAQLFRNTSSPGTISFSFATSVSGGTGTTSYHVAINDINGDGKPDLAMSNINNEIRLFQNNSAVGAISFGTAQNLYSSSAYALALNDLDNDGKPEIAATNFTGTNVSVYKNKSGAPAVISFTPTAAAAGATVTITGVNFTGVTAVSFGGVPAASFSVVNATTITAVVGTGASGNVSVTNAIGTGTKSGFTFAAPPVITSFNPTTATTGATVTISGSNFTDVTAVSFGGVPASSFTIVNPTTINAIVGIGASGNVAVTNPYATGTLAGFTYVQPPPTITSFSPTFGGTGSSISISGTNFTGATAVSFGGVPATSFSIVSANNINAVVGAGASGNVSVTTPGGTANMAGFIYVPPPILTSFTPTSGAPNTLITLTGSNFSNVTGVSFGGTPASSFSIVNSTTITALVGTGATGDVTVSSPYGNSSLAGFTYLPPPVITSFAPASGAPGTTVTITGANFSGAGITNVFFGGTAVASFTVVNATTLSVVTGVGSSGPITIHSSFGSTFSSSSFTFVYPAPTISSFSPSSGTTGTSITVTGSNFTSVPSVNVTFGGVAASSVVVNSATSLTAVVGNGASGNVSVITHGGTASLPGFTYVQPPPTILAFIPNAATPGTAISIVGTNFTGATAVSFGGVAASSFIVNSNTSITAIVGQGASGSVAVTTPGGTGSQIGFTFGTPKITSFSPTSGGAGTVVNIQGSGFDAPFINVTFGDVNASAVTVNSPTSITATVGAGASGYVRVTSTGSIAAEKAGFTFISPTTVINAVSPSIAASGSTVNITGYNFTGATAVSFGGTAASSFTVNSTTSITAVVGNGTSGSVSVTSPTGTATYSGFIFTSAPVITSFSPLTAPVGATVTIAGHNFNLVAANNIVYFGGMRTIVTAASATSLSVFVPFGGSFEHISVTNNGLTGYSAKRFSTTFLATGNLNASSFASRIDSVSGTATYHVSAFDMDVDGKADIAASNSSSGSNSVSLFRNTGSAGTIAFSAKQLLQNNKVPANTSYADFDGDGKQDIAIGNSADGTGVSVYRNTSSGTTISFSNELVLNMNLGRFYSAAGDFDGDGKPDIAIAGVNSFVEVRRNTSTAGTISFSAPLTVSAGGPNETVSVSDIDMDGKPDLVVSNAQSLGFGSIRIFRNTSTATALSFAPPLNFSTGIFPRNYFIGDVDGDGLADITVPNEYNNTISIFRNNSVPGTIKLDAKVEYFAGSGPNFVSMADLDGNGKADVMVANDYSSNISVFPNASTSGSILLGTKIDYTVGNNPRAVIASDIDIDGKPDLITANAGAGSVSFLRNQVEAYTITSFSPLSGTTGTIVTITGTNLSAVTAVSIGGTPVQSFTINSSTTITAVVANGTSGYVSVTTPGGIVSLPWFTYNTVTSTGGSPGGNSKDLIISPNPADEKVIVKHPAAIKSAELSIVDMLGRPVKKMLIGRNVTQTEVNIRELSAGIYKILWTDGKKQLRQTIFVY